MKKLKLGFMNFVFTSDDGWLECKSFPAKLTRLMLADIETVSISDKGAGMGKCNVAIIGRGTTMAEFNMPQPWGIKAQKFIMEEVSSRQ